MFPSDSEQVGVTADSGGSFGQELFDDLVSVVALTNSPLLLDDYEAGLASR